MFIKLTRTDGRPIWINPEFIVTVEGRKGGGAIVVPAGDGLDYDVKESPEAVMRLCGGGEPLSAAEQPTAEPTEQPTAEPTDVLPMQDAPAVSVAQAEATVQALREKVKRLREAAEAEKSTDWTPSDGKDTPPEAPPAEDAAAEKPVKKEKSKPAAKPRKRTSRKMPVIDLTDEQMERLKKMAPSSRQKLLNTLAHLKVPNAEATAVALLAHKVIEMTPDNHVNWLAQ